MNKDINAIGIVKQMIADGQVSQEVAEKYFPELKESEGERVWLIKFIQEEIDCIRFDIRDYEDRIKLENLQRSLSWLEKKGEQKPDICVDYKEAIMHVVRHYVIPDEIDDELRRIAKGEWKYATWSEEDEAVLDALIRKLEGEDIYVSSHLAVECIKSLKDKVQPKQEWSEQEQVRINRIVSCLENLNVADNDILLKDIDWLKSLRPKSTWKPSDEQMDALHYVTNFDYGGHKATLVSLYEQLKKLKEE